MEKHAMNIVYVAVDKIFSNPDNPRKNIGDISELAESVKNIGIKQPLTVIEHEGGYMAVIGHRRLAAARLAGLETVPCIIDTMSRREQVGVMLSENMQRADLTPIEEADSMQLMIDMGATVDEVSKETSCSRSKVYSRLRIAKLDRQLVQGAFERNATLEDFDKVSQIKSEEARNAVIEKIGTNNFEMSLRNALDSEKIKEKAVIFDKWLEENGIEKRTNDNSGRYIMYIDLLKFDENAAPQLDKLPDGERYYINETPHAGERSKYLYRTVLKEDNQKDSSSYKHIYEEQRKKHSELDRITEKMFNLRSDWIKNYPGFTEKDKSKIGTFTWLFLRYSQLIDISYEQLEDIFNIGKDEENADMSEYTAEVIDKYNIGKILVSVLYKAVEWDIALPYNWNAQYQSSERLNAVYDILKCFGYPISDEEAAILDGTHKAYYCEQED